MSVNSTVATTRSPALCGAMPPTVRARPFDRHPRLVADHPGIMPGRDVEDGVGQDVEDCLPIVHVDVQDTGDGVPEMVDLAAFGVVRCEIDRTIASRDSHTGGPSDGRSPRRTTLSAALGKRAHLIGAGEVA